MTAETPKEKKPTRAMKLNEMISYQTGAVVSRTLIDEDAGTVTLFAFDEKQGLSEHTAPYDAMVIAIDGEAEITISAKTHRLGKDEMTIMPANKPHAVKATKRFKMLLIMVRK